MLPAGTGNVTLTYQVSAQSDASGMVTVALLPTSGNITGYTVSVYPPSDSNYASTTSDSNLLVGTTSGVGATITLSPRTTVSGRVLDPTGKPLAGVNLNASASTLAALAANSAVSLANVQQPTALTDSLGVFALRLDPGIYDFGLQPPLASDLPNLWIDDQPISGTGPVALGDLTLKPAYNVLGYVTYQTGHPAVATPLAGATVLVYQIGVGTPSCHADDTSCQPPPLLLAQGTTAADGSVVLLLPASQTTP